eukprot:6348217-Pyramimonas_sp.AAC.1
MQSLSASAASSCFAKCRVSTFPCCSSEPSALRSESAKIGTTRTLFAFFSGIIIILLVAGPDRSAAPACCHAALCS